MIVQERNELVESITEHGYEVSSTLVRSEADLELIEVTYDGDVENQSHIETIVHSTFDTEPMKITFEEDKIQIYRQYESLFDRRVTEVSRRIENIGVTIEDINVDSDMFLELTPFLDGKIESQQDFNAVFDRVLYTVDNGDLLADNYTELVHVVEDETDGWCHVYDDALRTKDTVEIIVAIVEIDKL